MAGVSLSDFYGSGKARGVVSARAAAVAIMHQDRRMSYPEIARAMQRSSHSTALGQHRKYLDCEFTVGVASKVRARLAAMDEGVGV